MLRTLVLGRISIAAASVSAAKVGLTVAVRYAAGRPQFGPEGAPEQPILDYPLVQRALLPRLATTLALHFGVRRLQADVMDPEKFDGPELEVAAAGLKAYASEHCVQTLQACREACGGRGYLAESRFAALKADTDVFTTFEGANPILYQLVAKGLLSRFRDEMGDLTLRRAVRYLAERAETAITELNPVATRRTDDEHLMDPDLPRSGAPLPGGAPAPLRGRSHPGQARARHGLVPRRDGVPGPHGHPGPGARRATASAAPRRGSRPRAEPGALPRSRVRRGALRALAASSGTGGGSSNPGTSRARRHARSGPGWTRSAPSFGITRRCSWMDSAFRRACSPEWRRHRTANKTFVFSGVAQHFPSAHEIGVRARIGPPLLYWSAVKARGASRDAPAPSRREIPWFAGA